LLTKERTTGPISHQGVRLKHARIIGTIDFENASLDQAFEVYDSHIDGGINLRFVETNKAIQLGGSRIDGVVDASGFRAKSDFDPTNVLVRPDGGRALMNRREPPRRTDLLPQAENVIVLRNARIDGSVKLSGARVFCTIEAANLIVVGDSELMAMDLPAEFGTIDLGQATIAGQSLGY
jgi:hypothetical protein